MNKEIVMVKEDVEVGLETISLEIPVRLEMTSINNAPFEFETTIDELGQIKLTPTTKDVEFISANTEDTVEYDIPIKEQETIVTSENDSSSYEYTTMKTSITIHATMLAESDNHKISADIDEIGQAVICPMSKQNTFVTATLQDSLNLITEENQDKQCDTEDCDTEEGEITEEPLPDTPIKAEVIEEEVVDATKKSVEFTEVQIDNALSEITNDYTEPKGVIRCDTKDEQSSCFKKLQLKYKDISGYMDNSCFIIVYAQPVVLTESIESDDIDTIINKFMRAELPIYSDDGKPLSSYIHISDLDSNGYSYYYDPETSSIVTYVSED